MEAQDSYLLVVDDNERNRDILSRKLTREGYQVAVAVDGESALAHVESERVDLLILDIMMPGIDGFEVLRRLRETYTAAELPIIMASAKSDAQDIVMTARLGANDHVAKPFDSDVLMAKIQALLILKQAVTPVAAASAEPSRGEIGVDSVIAGKFRLEEQIGSGTFGAVFKARHLELDHQVAVKVLQAGLTSKDNSLERFRQEGVAACRVRHPNAVHISDYGVTESGVAYLVMELLQGRSLGEEMDEVGALAPRRALEIVHTICDVLAQAHASGLVHRDIKPDNIFLHQGPSGEVVKVLDFGIAKLVGEAALRNNLTADGWILGTPAYMAPERLLGTYDGRADVYSVGVMLFEMLTGRKPFLSENNDPMSLVHKHTDEPPPTLRGVAPNLPEDLEIAVGKALRKDSAARPDAVAWAAELERCLAAGQEKAGSVARGGDGGTRHTSVTKVIHVKTDPQPKLFERLLKKVKR